MNFNDKLTELKGVGPKTQKLFLALGISNLGKLICSFPRTYHIYPQPIQSLSDIPDGKKTAICAVFLGMSATRKTPRVTISAGAARFDVGKIELVWFNMPYISKTLYSGKRYVFYGLIKRENNGRLKMEQPEVFKLQDYERIKCVPQPIYSLTKGLSNNAVKKAVSQVISDGELTEEYLPPDLVRKRNLESRGYAIRQIHFPDSFDSLKSARDRLVYDEFFDFFMRIYMDRTDSDEIPNPWFFGKHEIFDAVLDKLPFELTPGQRSALNEITEDMRGDIISQRLIQGDVGSGKTIIAFLAMLLAVENGYTAAIMAPTEVLARQHFETFLEYFSLFGLDYEAVLLTGSVKGAERRQADRHVADTSGIFIIGTHAVFSEKMKYKDLALVITDEQHRFGVKQRKDFAMKGANPHVLVMSATPIPRSLAMILYGDMSISVIRDVPARRKPIKNSLIGPEKRPAAYRFIKKELDSGRQAYIICPLVEASEKTEAANVTEYKNSLDEFYQGSVSTGILHGRMSPEEKTAVMADFSEGKIQVLVSTTVVEVGVNVPNATVMLIEDANRFGLAQLHQLRGRVGRGEHQSYCMFLDTSGESRPSERLSVIAGSNDGFVIAESDLKARGPGDFFGIRQSGDMSFILADIYQDAELLGQASRDVKNLLAEDPELKSEKGRRISAHLSSTRDVVYTNL